MLPFGINKPGKVTSNLEGSIEATHNKGDDVEQQPTIGRIVHYQRYGTLGGEHKPEPSPAIITRVNESDQTCDLFVMNPNGCYFNRTPFAAEPKPGHWNWPPRV